MKYMNVARKFGRQIVAGSALVLAAGSAMAAGPDYASLTTGLDWSTAITGILAIGALLIGVYAAIKGAKMIIGMVRS